MIILVLPKFSIDDFNKWYKHVGKVQVLNSTYHRNINTTPFELLFGIKMRNKFDLKLREMVEKEFWLQFEKERNQFRIKAKEQILKIQSGNCKTYNFRHKKSSNYNIGDLVAIRRTQLGPGRKLRAKYLSSYVIKKTKSNDTYDVTKVGDHEDPSCTSTCAEYLKPWTHVRVK